MSLSSVLGPVAAVVPLLAQEPFERLSLAEALQKASKEERVVIVDFFTTWCAPCKEMDRVTWSDDQVGAWLEEHSIPIKVDAEREEAIASRYQVTAYPTILFLRPDGAEMDRVIGFRDAAEFLLVGGEILAGISPVERMVKELEAAGGNDPGLRRSLAKELQRRGRDEEALQHYMWCWDHALEHDPGFSAVRLSFLLDEIARFGGTYPAALTGLRERRDACETELRAGRGDGRTAKDLTAINRALAENERTLEVYEELAGVTDLPLERAEEMRRTMFAEISDLLLAERRYEDVLEGAGDYRKRFDEYVLVLEEARKHVDGDDPAIGVMQSRVVAKGAMFYECLLGVGRREEAGQLLERILGVNADYTTFKSLIGSALRAGDREAARQIADKSKVALPEKYHRRLERAANRD